MSARQRAAPTREAGERSRRSRRNPRRERARTPRPSRRTPQRRRRNPRQNKTRTLALAGASSPEPSRATPAAPATAKPDRAPARETLRVGAQGPGRLLERETRIRGLLARDRQAHRSRRIHPRVVRRPGISAVQEPAPGHRRSASRVPRLGQVTARKSILRKLNGAACGSPLFISRTPESRLRPSHPQHQETKL